jgi:hypothetical protein
VARLVYVPVYPEMPVHRLDAMAGVLRSVERERIETAPGSELQRDELEAGEVSRTQLA